MPDATPSPATVSATTRAAIDAFATTQPWDDTQDFDDAEHGFVARSEERQIRNAEGRVVWDLDAYRFLDGPPADTANPSLWRQGQLLIKDGLFEVVPGIYQLRGFDLSVMSVIEGDTGVIVIDPLISRETAAAAFALYTEHRGARPVVAMIYTHSHIDHFGGVKGIITDDDVASGRTQVIAPEGFMDYAVSENVYAGTAMARRAGYMYGAALPKGPAGQIGTGLGQTTSLGEPTLIAPTVDITTTGQELVIDGVRIVFQVTPGTEAPAEMNFFFPDHGWLCTAENCTHTMHNLVPIRGALIRDSLKWSKYIGEMIELFGSDTELMFASHHWPRWGNADVLQYLVRQRDLYRWMHDQTMRFANHGYNATEIAELLSLPPEFAAEGHTTGYYGDLVHNVKAVFQRYLSWYDGNPANLWKLPPVDAGRRYVELAGGSDALLAAARSAFDAGDYRWVAELLNHLVFADPTNVDARELQADTFEQLGYQAQSATFRNAFLMGAQELRNGTPDPKPATRNSYLDAMTIEQIVDSLAVKVKSEEVGGLAVSVNLSFTDLGEDWVLRLSNRTLHGVRGRHDADAAVTFTLTKRVFQHVIEGGTTFAGAVAAGDATAVGDVAAAGTIFDHLDVFMNFFKLVEP